MKVKKILKYVLTTMLAVSILGAGFAMGYLYDKIMIIPKIVKASPVLVQPSDAVQTTPAVVGNEAEPVSYTAKSVGPNTKVKWITVFEKCGHKIEEDADTASYIGLTLEELKTKYPNAKIVSLSSDLLVMQKTVSQYCPNHLMVKSDDHGLIVLKTNEKTLEPAQIMRFDVDITQLPDDLVNQLKEGIVFDTLEQIDSYLEGIES